MMKLGEKLKHKVEVKARENFNRDIGKGKKLTYEEIKNLNSLWKQDYVKVLMKEN